MDRREMATQAGNLRRFSSPSQENFFVYRSLLKYFETVVVLLTNTSEPPGGHFKSSGVGLSGELFSFLLFLREKSLTVSRGGLGGGWLMSDSTTSHCELCFFQFHSHSNSHPSTHFPHTFYTQRGDFLFLRKMKRKVLCCEERAAGVYRVVWGRCAFLSYICTARKNGEIFFPPSAFFSRIFHN